MSGAVEHLWVVKSTTDFAGRCTQIDERWGALIGRSRSDAALRQPKAAETTRATGKDNLFSQIEAEAAAGRGGDSALARKLVELRGGAIEAVRAGAGKGREFVVRMPLDAASADDGEAPHELEPSRVLIVDDDQDVAGSLAMLIESLGAETRIAYDGASAVEAAVEFEPEVALIDIRMDGVDGYETARRVRARLGVRTPLMVALTGLGQDRDREAAIEAGFDLHLTKPVSADALEQVLRGARR